MPWRFKDLALDLFKELEIRDFKNPKYGQSKKSREYVTEISAPTIAQFKNCLATRFLEIYGPRKLISFIQRCTVEGPWAEIAIVWKKAESGSVNKYKYSKLELELLALQKVHRSYLKLPDEKLKRYEELLVTMSPAFMEKTDAELSEIANKWIDSIKDVTPSGD